MQIKLFTIPVGDNGAFEEKLNRFLPANRILGVTGLPAPKGIATLKFTKIRFLPAKLTSLRFSGRNDMAEMVLMG